MATVSIEDHSAEVLAAKNRAIEAALEAIGNQAVSHAKSNITAAGRVDTGAMRNSMNHQVAADEETVYVGTNQEYAIYNELGTGIYAEGGNGRQTPWVYVDEKGQGHRTRGMTAIHFLRNAVQDHIAEFVAIGKRMLKGG